MRNCAPAQPRHHVLPAPPAPPPTLVEAMRACATANLADCLPHALAEGAIEACLELMARELKTFEAIRCGTLPRGWILKALGRDVAA